MQEMKTNNLKGEIHLFQMINSYQWTCSNLFKQKTYVQAPVVIQSLEMKVFTPTSQN